MLDKVVENLQKYAMIIGVVTAIGGGFYAWGEFNTRLSSLEGVSYESTDLSGINEDIKELNEKINDRVNALGASQEEDYQQLKEEIDGLKKDIAISSAAMEYLDAKIEELKAEQSNPLLN